MKYKMKINMLASILIIILGVTGIANHINIWATSISVLYIVLLAFCAKNPDKHIILLMFSGCYYAFLVGGILVNEYLEYDMLYDYSVEYYDFMLYTIFYSLLLVFIGYIFSGHIYKNKVKESTSLDLKDEPKIKMIRKLSLCSHYIFLNAYILVLIEAILIVRKYGYYSYYSYESNLPYIVTELSELYIVALFLFLATLPEKKEAKIPLFIFFALNCVSLFTGRRIYFVIDNMIIICYGFFRNKLTPNDKWITRKHILILIFLLPVIAVFLYVYNYIRMNRTARAETFLDAMFLFFKQQGFSANLIPLGKKYSYRLGDDYYTMYDILKNIRLNPLVRVFTNSSYRELYTGTRANVALKSGSFAKAISYAVVKNRYLGGYGMGSCYIAELYHDFGHVGVCIGNLLYGFTLARINCLSTSKIIGNTFILLMLRGFFKAPRYCFDSPFYFLLSVPMWLYFCMVFFMSNQILSQKKVV